MKMDVRRDPRMKTEKNNEDVYHEDHTVDRDVFEVQ